MLVIVSPSKSQNFDKVDYSFKATKPRLLKNSIELVDELKKLKQAKIEKLMSVSSKIAGLNVERYKNFTTPFTSNNAKPAILSFTGDVYDGIQVEEYKKKDFEFAQNHLRILSGLYGVLRPLDLMQAYRLEMKTKLKNSRGKDLYEFWGDLITNDLNKDLKAKEPLINLASKEYFSAVNQNILKADVITPVFKEAKGSDFRIVAIFAKRARGMMADFIVCNRIKNVSDLKDFKQEGYKFNSKLSRDKEYVFTRKK